MTNGCGLGTWSTNSRIEHAVSDSPVGPYAFKDVAINTWAHNAAPIALPGGVYAIVHIGGGGGTPDGGKNCTNASEFAAAEVNLIAVARQRRLQQHHRIHVSTSLDGPWEP